MTCAARAKQIERFISDILLIVQVALERQHLNTSELEKHADPGVSVAFEVLRQFNFADVHYRDSGVFSRDAVTHFSQEDIELKRIYVVMKESANTHRSTHSTMHDTLTLSVVSTMRRMCNSLSETEKIPFVFSEGGWRQKFSTCKVQSHTQQVPVWFWPAFKNDVSKQKEQDTFSSVRGQRFQTEDFGSQPKDFYYSDFGRWGILCCATAIDFN